MLAAAAIWRVRSHRRARSLVRAALTDPNTETRRAGAAVIGEHGLAPYADVLAALVASERDETVLEAVAAAVARNQWEPADDPRLVELRLWARSRRAAAGGAGPGGEAARRPELVEQIEDALGEPVVWLRLTGADGRIAISFGREEDAS